MSRIKESVEALIFAFGDGIKLEELKTRTKADPLLIKKAINELNKGYVARGSAFSIVEEGDFYRMRLRHDLVSLIENNLKTDLKRGVLMTLSVIATSGKIKQTDLVKMRGSLSYQHVKELVSRGLITTTLENKHKVIRLSSAFYDYFDINSKEFKEITEDIKKELEKREEQTVNYRPN